MDPDDRNGAADGEAIAASRALEYQPGAAVRRRHRWRRALWVALAAGLVAAVVWRGPAAYRKVRVAYWERQARAYVAPAERVVYEEDPGRSPGLLARPGYRGFASGSPGWNGFVAFTAEPVRRLAEASGLRVGLTAVFAHARRTPSGRERLVVVWVPSNGVRPTAQGATPDNQVQITMYASVVDDGVMVRAQRVAPWVAPRSVAENRETPLYARMYAGQVDPADPSHFTIAFEIGEHHDVLDGYLREGDKVVLRPRNHEHMLNPK